MTDSFRVLSPGPEWDVAMQRLVYDVRDVHFTSGWAQAHEGPGVTAHLAVLERDGFMVCQPLLLRRIEGTPFTDLTWPGYGGPLTDHPLPSYREVATFESFLSGWREAAKVVSEFYLLNPALIEKQAALILGLSRRPVREVTILPAETAYVLKSMRPNRRQAFYKGEGAEVDWCPADAAQALYDTAMDRLGAPARWRLPKHLERLPKGRTHILGAYAGGELKAMAVFLIGANCAYYYLSARSADCPTGYPDQLIMAGVQLAHERACTWMNLGGGLKDGDTLAAYKKSWGGFQRPLYSVRRVHDVDTYGALSGPQHKWGDFFPAYRAKETA